jgi:hypothetical protein
MPLFIVTGKLGSGKTLSMVARMRSYLEAGKPVATNVDIDLRQLTRRKPKATLTRLPDKPTAEDFAALGQVHATAREELNGALVLDECGTWLNTRQWGDKGRQAIIDWLLHSRKLGWDVFLIVQNLSLVDKQIRDALAEYVVICRRLDRLKIPYLAGVIKLLSFGLLSGRMPKVHVATVFYGVGQGAMKADRWTYRGTDLYRAYQSVQVIASADARDVQAGSFCYVWYATDKDRASWPVPPKPKLPEVQRLRALPKERQWHWARQMALDRV